jgi:hypothetical protein
VTVFIVSSVLFVVVMLVTLRAQKKNERRMATSAAQLNETLGNVVPLVQRQHERRFGRASTALEGSFPGGTLPPQTKAR